MLVDTDATIAEASRLSRAVLLQFRRRGLIAGRASSKCVLGGKGFRPGPAIAELYKLGTFGKGRREHPFWEWMICGVEPRVGRGFNEWALGPVCEGFTCPACGTQTGPFTSEFSDALGKAINQWIHSGTALLRCPECKERPSFTQWHCKPPLGFGNLSFRFWNWPPLDSSSWKVDIVALVREITCHTIILTHGHL